jgi:hypothetical protein
VLSISNPDLILELFDIVIEEIYAEMSDTQEADQAIIDQYWQAILDYRRESAKTKLKAGLTGAGIGAGCILLLWLITGQ